MKTPDGKDTNAPSRSLPELKKALRYLKDDCDKPEPCLENCPYWFECNSVFYPRLHVPHAVIMDALAYIKQLEAERDQYKRELDTAIIELRGYGCEQCVHSDLKNIATICCNCKLGSLWEWQGLK